MRRRRAIFLFSLFAGLCARASVPLPIGFFKGSTPSSGPSVELDDFTGLSSWFRSMDLSLAEDDPAGTWEDRSVNNVDVTSSGSQRPLFKTNILDGKPALRFDGSDDRMSFPSGIGLFTDFTIIALLKLAADGQVFLGTSGIPVYLAHGLGGPANCTRIFSSGTGEGLNSSTFGGAATDAKVIILRKSSGTITFRENKTARGTGAFTSWQYDRVGYANTSSLNGDYIELALWNTTALSDADLDSIYNNYFKFHYPSLP